MIPANRWPTRPHAALTDGGRPATLCGVTSEGTAPSLPADETDAADAPALRCYRHPDRETYVRCGRCDQPICTRCAMQGPVGFRCRECGRPARDPLTSIRPAQAAIGFAVAAAGGLVVGLLTSRIGFFGLLLAWFGGGLIADGVMRFVGFKRGPRMMAILFGGIAAGALAAFAVDVGSLAASLGPDGGGLVGAVLLDRALWAGLAAGLACFGAWSRFRF